ncbi:MAG: hypothetical protein JST92_01395, partial [Deltaproteobacteria bacterium]|nr:hypothetical protein [Deltaproteobacteria bacterium]
DARLLQGIQGVRDDARLLLCGTNLPPAVLDAIGQGADVKHTDRPEHLRREVHSLARPRSLMVRHQLPELTVLWTGGDRKVPLLDVSNGGLSFRLELDDELERLLPGAVLTNLVVDRDGAPGLMAESAVVRYVEQAQGPNVTPHYRVGCELLAALPSAQPVKSSRLTDGAARAGLLRAALKAGALSLQTTEGDGAATQIESGHVDLEHGELRLHASLVPFEAWEVVRGTFELGGGSYRFLTSVKSVDPLVLRLPAQIEGAHRRSSARWRPEGGEPIKVELESPLLPGGPARRTVLEISSTGLSFEAHPEFDLFPPGMRLTRVELKLGSLTLRCRGEVKNLLPLPHDTRTLRCGIVLEGLSATERTQLADAVMRRRFPGLADGQDLPVDNLWQFFLDTRFLYPEKLAALGPVAGEVRQTFEKLRTAGSGLFKSLVFTEGEKVFAHLSAARAYRRTWLVQHLAGATRLKGRQAPRIVNLGLSEYFGQNTDLEYVKVFFRPDNKWPARVFGSFAKRMTDRQLSDLRELHYQTLPTDCILPGNDQIRVIEADGGDLSVVERHFVATERGLMLRSDDLTRASLGMSELSEAWKAAGMQRERRVLLALRGDEPVGFALAEISSPGLNLSELLSAFRLVVLPSAVEGDDAFTAAEKSAQIRQQLVRAVLPLYRHAGRPFAVGLFKSGELETTRLPALQRKVYVQWTCHRTLYRKFSEHVDRLYELLDTNRRERSGSDRDGVSDGERVRGDAA